MTLRIDEVKARLDEAGGDVPLASALHRLHAHAPADLALLVEAVERLASLADDLAANWDHDEEAHRYGTTCRVCLGEAEEAWLRERGLVASGATKEDGR